MSKHAVMILGASGYSGAELLRYVGAHPAMRLVCATADTNAGRTLGELYPHLVGLADVRLEQIQAAVDIDADLAFLALPHGAAAEVGRSLVARGVRVVDLSADWRLRDAAAYDAWYGWSHPRPDELGAWVYGLSELHRNAIAGATAVANPGCYPSAALLALAPPLAAQAIEPEGIVIDAASGVSGAGRKVEAAYLFTELDSSYTAYRVGRHQHTPEIEQELGGATVVFTPHLAPMARGILATCYARMTAGEREVREALASAFKAEPFVHVLPDGAQPATKQVWGTNLALIGVACDERTRTAIVTCAIDNLGKGAAGQAVQNANLMLGLPETAGLEATAVYP